MKKLHYSLLGMIIILHYYLYHICRAQQSSSIECGESLFLENSDSPINRMVFCNSGKPYFRTSIGLFPISSINYTTKLLTVSQPSSSSCHYVSPSLLVAGFPRPPSRNLIIVFNCSNTVLLHETNVSFFSNGTHLAVDDLDATGFEPKDLNCSNYYWAHEKSYSGEGFIKYEAGIRVSFDVPAHVPNLCYECQKPDGHCGVGLKCICHPQECSKFNLYSRKCSNNHLKKCFYECACMLLYLFAGDQIVARSGSLHRLDLAFVPRFALIMLLLITPMRIFE